MGTWSTLFLAADSNLGYSYYPAIWADSGNIYAKAQGERDVNIYNIAADTWSSIELPTGSIYQLFESVACRQELLWVANGKLYVLGTGSVGDTDNTSTVIGVYNLTTGAKISRILTTATLGSGDGSFHGNWGRNRHKQVVKDEATGRIFLINFYMKQVYEFNANETLTLVKTWTEGIGGNGATDKAGCDAVAINGMLYIVGLHTSIGGAAITGPLEINMSTYATAVKAVYPDYANQGAYTYNQYENSAWVGVGNYILAVGGSLQSWQPSVADGPVNVLRAMQYDPSANAWADLGVIPSSILHAGAIGYGAKAYLLGGYITAAAAQSLQEFAYRLLSVTAVATAYDPVDGAVVITWTDTSGQTVTGYIIDRREQDGTVWTVLSGVASAIRQYRDVPPSLRNYYYRVRPYLVQV